MNNGDGPPGRIAVIVDGAGQASSPPLVSRRLAPPVPHRPESGGEAIPAWTRL